MVKRKCTHQCMAVARSTKKQCRHLALLHEDRNHTLINNLTDESDRAYVFCPYHFGVIFDYEFISKGRAKTTYGICTQEDS